MIEQEEVFFSEAESLQLITKMINKAKCDFIETGISALMWGSIVTFCALVEFASFYYRIPWADWVWLLTFFAVIPQLVISAREARRKKVKTYNDDSMGGIWIAFGISMFLFNFYFYSLHVPLEALHTNTLFLIVYGIPTFSTGFARRFTPMLLGGMACWVFAIISLYTPYPYVMLLVAGGAILAWFIPGLILQRRYLKAKRGQHV